MKKGISVVLSLFMILCLVSCGNSVPALNENDLGKGTEEFEEFTDKVESDMKAEEETTATANKEEEAEATATPTQTPVSTPAPTVEPTPEPSAEPTEKPTATPEPHMHKYEESIIVQATCAIAGEKKLTCSCGDTKTESIPASGEHNWVEQTQIVHHDEVGSMKTVQVGTNTRTVYYCLYCRVTLGLGDDAFSADNQTDVRNHCIEAGQAILDAGGSLDEAREHATARGFCIDYSDPVYEEQYIVQSPAYDETVVTGYICSVCGATK